MLAQTGDTAGAIEQYLYVVGTKPEYLAARLALAGLYLKVNQADRALEQLRAAAKLDAQNASVWEQIGDAEKSLNHRRCRARSLCDRTETADREERSQAHSHQDGLLKMTGAQVRLKFWGVRGSTPTPQIENLKFGGNTSCLEIRNGENECVIFDAGSGIRALGQTLMQEAAGAPIEAKIFLTHFHWDHIQGIPFFAPLYGPDNHISFVSGSSGLPLQETLEGQMAKPYFPIDFSQVAAKRDFHQIGRETRSRWAV